MLSGKSSKDRVTVASEKAGFIADRVAAGVPATEEELRRLARCLREIAAQMSVGLKSQPPTRTLGDPDPQAVPR